MTSHTNDNSKTKDSVDVLSSAALKTENPSEDDSRGSDFVDENEVTDLSFKVKVELKTFDEPAIKFEAEASEDIEDPTQEYIRGICDQIVYNTTQLNNYNGETLMCNIYEQPVHVVFNDIGKSLFTVDENTMPQTRPSRTEKERPYVCEQCSKAFPYKSDLLRHERVHTGEKPYPCSECGKSFAQKDHLTVHRRVHTGEKSFVCKECGRAFARKDFLNKHVRVHAGEKPHVCKECGKSFAQKNALVEHFNSHFAEAKEKKKSAARGYGSQVVVTKNCELFNCSFCRKTFLSNTDLENHMKIHADRKSASAANTKSSLPTISYDPQHMLYQVDENAARSSFLEPYSEKVSFRVEENLSRQMPVVSYHSDKVSFRMEENLSNTSHVVSYEHH